jgi:UTP--glucose-1-phosphate uridylyltransferase
VAASIEERGLLESADSAVFLAILRRLNLQRPLEWSSISSPPAEMLFKYESLPACPREREAIRSMLSKVVVVKLNGGLGTSMGCTGPKSIIEVRDGLTFLDMTVIAVKCLNQEFDVDVPLVLMNSFNTHEDTLRIVDKYATQGVRILSFKQSCFPRLDGDTWLPLPSGPMEEASGETGEWYPPGHGDFYYALSRSGLLDSLIEEGREYAFSSNIDNLGATIDMSLLAHCVTDQPDFLEELTPKTASDVKGGTLALQDGKLRQIEVAQVPPEHLLDFTNVKKFATFNTNNVWVRLAAARKLVTDTDGAPPLDVIVNRKKYKGRPVIQLETAIAAAVQCFPKAQGVVVPRSRFLPVKKTSDLLLVRSNLYTVEDGRLVPGHDASPPVVKLGPEFTFVSDFMRRFPSAPDIVDLQHLTVSGDVCFGRGVRLAGDVVVVASPGKHIDVPDGCKLENKCLTGELSVVSL